MTLINVGSLTINFDQVALVRDLSPDPVNGPRLVRVEFAGGHAIDLTAHAAEVMSWVAQNSSTTAGGPVVTP